MMEVWTKEDVIEAIKKASEEVTNDCSYSGVLTLGAILLGVSEDTVMELIEDE